jgi:uncharacterized membrane protein YiaA
MRSLGQVFEIELSLSPGMTEKTKVVIGLHNIILAAEQKTFCYMTLAFFMFSDKSKGLI